MMSKVFVVLLSAASAAIVATAGGQKELGYFALARVVPMIFVLFTGLGITDAYPYLIRKMAQDPVRVFRSGAFSFLLIATSQIGIWLLLVAFLRGFLFRDFSNELVLLVGAVAPLQIVHLHATNLLRSIDRVRQANLVGIAVEIALLIQLILYAVVWGISYDTLVVAVFISWAFVLVILIVLLWRMGYPFVPVVDLKLLQSSIHFGIRTQASNALQLLNYRLDQLIIGGFLGAADLGLYAVASKAAELFRFFSRSISFVVEPLLAGKSTDESRVFVSKAYGKIFLINFLFMSFGVLVVPLVLPVFFGEWSNNSSPIFYVLAIGMMLGGGNGLIGAYNKAVGQPEKNMRVITVGLVVAVVGNLLLIPRMGVSGAAWAAVATQAVITILFGVQFRSSSREVWSGR